MHSSAFPYPVHESSGPRMRYANERRASYGNWSFVQVARRRACLAGALVVKKEVLA